MKSATQVARTVFKYGPWAIGEVARRGLPRHLVHFYGQTPGDDLMCTVVLRELRKRGHAGIWMMSRFPSLFDGNQDVDHVVPFDFRYQRMITWARGRDLYTTYGAYDAVADRNPVPERHIISLMCQSAGITGPVTLRPYFTLTDSERQAGRISDKQIVLHSSGKSAFSAMQNKEWVPDRLQAVVDILVKDFKVIQLGATEDPLLEGCIDLRGQTTTRESAAIIAGSLLLLGQVGFLMHLARAVNRRAVIIYGGREMPWQSGYTCNANLATSLPCSPCWRWNACDNAIERECMRLISVDEVVAAVHATAARDGEPLVEDFDTIPLA